MSIFVFYPVSHDEFPTNLLEVSEVSRPVESESETSPHKAILCPNLAQCRVKARHFLIAISTINSLHTPLQLGIRSVGVEESEDGDGLI